MHVRVANALAPSLSLAGLLVGACSPSNSLTGSMANLTPLDFTQVFVKVSTNNTLVIEYADFVDGGGNIPFELTVRTAGIPYDAGFDVLLDGGTKSTPPQPFGVASRSIVDDQRQFSAIQFGFINVDGPLVIGQQATGNFVAVFAYQNDGTLGSGNIVNGNFAATVTQ
jgi:hypothetical protein